MMHVAVLSDGYPPWEAGGAQRIAAQLAQGYRDRGHRVTVLTTASTPDEDGRAEARGIPAHRFYTPRPKALLPYLSIVNPWTGPRVGEALARLDPDVVHAHNVHWLSRESLRQASRLDVPVVKTYHDAGTFAYGEFTSHVQKPAPEGSTAYEANPLFQWRREGLRYFPLRNRLNRAYLHRHVDAGVAVSHALGQALAANGMPCEEVIHNGIDPEEVGRRANGETFRERHGLGEAPLVLFGGRTGYNKGALHLARAFRRLRDDGFPETRLVVTGDEAYVDRMREAAGPHAEGIHATGWIEREQLADAFAAASVVATPSIHLDPFPTVNLEALASATPVVTTCFGGASELVRDRIEGRVVNPLDVDVLTWALASFLRDPSRAAKAGQAGRRRVEEAFTLDEQVDAYLELLAEQVHAAGSRASDGPPAGNLDPPPGTS